MHTMALLSALMAGLALAAADAPARAANAPPGLQSCRLEGVDSDAWCGKLQRPLNPAEPQGRQIDIHFAVLPARARNKKPDPVFFLAGGPGQSAMSLAGSVSRMLTRLSNRRDVVLIDQRGTGRSAPLVCAQEPPTRPMADQADPMRQLAEMRLCRKALEALPHGDLRRYTTTIAMQDADAVRQALGAAQVNLVGGSYGTRAALEYMRQFPQAVRRAVLDGAAPPDMALPASFSTDSQSAFDALLADCEAAPACSERFPGLRSGWQTLARSLPREVRAAHPVTGVVETFTLTRDMALGLVRAPLYVPSLASALPLALAEAARGRFEPLLGLSTALSSRRNSALAGGMHFSVVCAEDVPRLAQASDPPGADFGSTFAETYTRTCADWPRGEVSAGFYTLPAATAATLVLSGGADPATPPRHGQRVVDALGAKARHVVVAQAGHGVMGIGCMRDVVYRFLDAASDDEALKIDAECAKEIPRPSVFLPIRAGTAPGGPAK